MRISGRIVCAFVAGWWIASAHAADRDLRPLIPANSVVLIEVDRPTRLFECALVRDVWGILRDSKALREAAVSPDAERLRQAARFLERTLETDWHTGLSRLTAGGLVIAVSVDAPGEEPTVTAVVTSDSQQTLTRFLDALHAELRRRPAVENDARQPAPAAAADKPAGPVEIRYRAHACYRVGNGHYTILDRSLVASNSEAGLKGALDRLDAALAGANDQPRFQLPDVLRFDVTPAGQRGDPGVPRPLAQVTVDLRVLKQDPKIADSLKLPAHDPAAVLLLGGYLDLLRRADFITAGLFADEEGLEVRVRLPVGAEGAPAALRGYFAGAADESAAPLLTPPGSIYSASWYRDYRRLWDARSALLEADAVRKIDDENARQRQQTGGVSLADLLQGFGPHFRAAAARSREQVYRTAPTERLPAVALAIEVRDEAAFRESIVTPLDRILTTVVLSTGNEIKTVDHQGTRLTTIRFAEKQPPGDAQQQVLYNFDPTYSLTRGHLLIGSTSEIVRGLIDELDRLKAEAEGESGGTATPPPALTEVQHVSFDGLRELLAGFRARIVSETIQNRGLSEPDAETEFQVIDRLLSRLGRLSQTTAVSPRQFDLRLRVGSTARESADESNGR